MSRPSTHAHPRNPGPPASRPRRARAAEEQPPGDLALLHELRVCQADLVRQGEEMADLRRELGDLRERHAEVFEHGPFACLILDKAGTVVECNLAASTLLAAPRSLLVGKALARFVTGRSRGAFERHLAAALGGGDAIELEIELRRADRAHLHLRVRSARIGLEGDRRLVIGLTDVTEATQTRAELLRARRERALGRLTRTIAHDFNNLLMGIVGSADVALAELPAGSRAGELVTEVRAAALRGAFLSGRLLAPPAIDGSFRAADVAEVVERSEVLLRGVLGDRVALSVHVASRGDRVRIHEGELERVLLNLVTNARNAMPGGGRLTVEVARMDLREAEGGGPLGLGPGRYALLVVKDTGVGMDAATRERVFDPFFTRGRGKGAGLGLTTVRGIVESAGGRVQLESAPGKGTTVRLLLPCLPEEPRPDDEAPGHAQTPTPPPAPPGPAPASAGSTVLLVEDDAASREALILFLRGRGYRVLPAGSAEEALRVCGERAGPIDAMLVDVGLAGSGGDRLVDDVLAVHPRAAVVFMSGRERSDEAVRRALRGRAATFLRKPFELDRLAKALAAAVPRR